MLERRKGAGAAMAHSAAAPDPSNAPGSSSTLSIACGNGTQPPMHLAL